MAELTAKEHDAVLKLNAEYRRAFFEKKVKEQGCFFVLADDQGPVVLQDDEYTGWIPVFTDSDFANEFAKTNEMENLKPTSVTLEAFNNSWAPMLRDNKLELGFMPVGEDGEFESGIPDCL
ncbi:MAG: DUF2750 domain-containing protein [Succinatimonas hippei]|nr:DUF2750 domain-containing protein [Succinatimonas hippei]